MQSSLITFAEHVVAGRPELAKSAPFEHIELVCEHVVACEPAGQEVAGAPLSVCVPAGQETSRDERASRDESFFAREPLRQEVSCLTVPSGDDFVEEGVPERVGRFIFLFLFLGLDSASKLQRHNCLSSIQSRYDMHSLKMASNSASHRAMSPAKLSVSSPMK